MKMGLARFASVHPTRDSEATETNDLNKIELLNTTGRPSMLSAIATLEDFKFLDRVLRNGDSSSVDRVVDSIHAVDSDHDGPTLLSVEVETGSGNRGETGLILPRSCRVQESETENIPTLAGQALYQSLNNGSGDGLSLIHI